MNQENDEVVDFTEKNPMSGRNKYSTPYQASKAYLSKCSEGSTNKE